MKFKLAVPADVLTMSQAQLLEERLASSLLRIIVENFPDWEARAAAGEITGGEIIIQKTDWTAPIRVVKPGIHVTVSLVSFKDGRNFDGLGRQIVETLKGVSGDDGRPFMASVKIFLQMTLDCPVVKRGSDFPYTASGDGNALLEFEG